MSHDRTLSALLDRISDLAEGDVSIEDLVDSIGYRAFPALILVPALIVTSPASAIPGLPTFAGLTISIVAAQYVCGRKSVWLPRFILKRSLSSDMLGKFLGLVRSPSRWIERILKPRLSCLADKPFGLVLGLLIMMLGMIMPLLEFIPFTSTIVAGSVSLLSLALLFRDGLLALLAVAILATGCYAIYSVLTALGT
ncbi:exopolysaccharide biosynthesis protein [Pelagibacterium lacus]|uniref:Exopolysaccharide biosynthesis protein n=1 Tax=Pelagibacterium lacus TaxID=2282655 RepID=A0A369VZD4_9HYPH|nr:exopolysaccharide biosynthesis protein [Pelagibacterium lacus]RDE07774.1 exopolysaccharide biosynthesis protein [Pelagibacterium lacus]